MNLRRWLPILEWLPQYTKKDLKGDVSAGLTVGIMLIPQGMAYALLAGIPPIYGLYASTIPLILYALLGTSRQLSVGPTATSSLLTGAGVLLVSEAGGEQAAQIAVLIALLVGVIQLILGLLRMGFLVNFLSNPVVSGFTSASALIIAFSQFKHLLGVKVPNTNYLHEMIWAILQQVSVINWISVGIGLLGVLFVRYTKKFTEAVPGALLAVTAGILLTWGLGLEAYGVAIVGNIPQGLPQPSLFIWDWTLVQTLLPTAAAISLVGFVESIAIAKAIQQKHRNYEVSPNQELLALGISKIGGAFFQSFATTGGFSRTAVNDRAGAQTNLAGILSALLIVLTLLFLTPIFYYLPQAILASVILAAIFSLVEIGEARRLWREYRSDFYLWLLTFAATLSIGILEGILIGAGASLVAIVYRSTHPHIALLGRIPQTAHYRNIYRFEGLEQQPDVLILRIDADLYFANSQYVKEFIESEMAKKGEDLRLVIVCAESISLLDSTAFQMLKDLLERAKKKGVQFYWAAVKGPIRDQFFRSGWINTFSEAHLFLTIQDAIDAYLQSKTPDTQTYAVQHNR